MIVLAHFFTAVRTFTTIAAGAVRTTLRLFVAFTSSAVWRGCGGLPRPVLLGRSAQNIGDACCTIAVVVAISLVPVALEIRRARRTGRSATALGDG